MRVEEIRIGRKVRNALLGEPARPKVLDTNSGIFRIQRSEAISRLSEEVLDFSLR